MYYYDTRIIDTAIVVKVLPYSLVRWNLIALQGMECVTYEYHGVVMLIKK